MTKTPEASRYSNMPRPLPSTQPEISNHSGKPRSAVGTMATGFMRPGASRPPQNDDSDTPLVYRSTAPGPIFDDMGEASPSHVTDGGARHTQPTAASAVSAYRREERETKDPAIFKDSFGSAAERANLPLPEARRDTPVIQPTSVVLDGKYRLIDELGRGSMGTVFLAEDILLRRKVAVKFLLPELAHSTECCIRFKREAIAMASIRNESVAQIFSYGEDMGTPYFVMEYLEGQTVEELIDAYNRRGLFIPLKKAVLIMSQVIGGVAAIHNANAVHRDIKPGNVMITYDPMRAVIMDFGLVRDIKVQDDMRTLAGTPAYIAPELVEGKTEDAKSKLADIYSLGATFYELVTGAIPFMGNSWVEILQKHIAEIPRFPSSLRPGLPESFDDLILRAMSKVPDERYQSGEELLDHLLQISEDANIMDTPGSSRAPRSSLFSHPPASANSAGARTSSSGVVRRYSSSAPGISPVASSASGTLLVADADTRFRSNVYSKVKANAPDIRIHSATDGLMAMDLLKTYHPDVLLINLALPEMNGFEIVASIVAERDEFQTNVIVVSENSGATGMKDAQLLRAMGVDHFYAKPVDEDALLEAMMPLLEGSGNA